MMNQSNEDEEESKEQNQQQEIRQQSGGQSNLQPLERINEGQEQQQNQNGISFNGFRVYYENPSDVIHILQQKKEQEVQQMQNQLDSSNHQIIEIICKVCFEGEEVIEEKGELLQPCLCSGSCQFIHEQCLKTWIVSRGQNIFEAKCEICNHKYEIKHSRKKKLNMRLSLHQNGTGSILTIILTVLFTLTFSTFLLFIIDIVLTIASEDDTLIDQDQTLKFVALFIIFVFTVGFFIGMIQSFRENCIYEHIINWQIFNFDKSKQVQGDQAQDLSDINNANQDNLQNQLNMINNGQQEQPVQISQINNVDNSAYVRQDTYSNIANQMNGIQMTHQNISHIQDRVEQQQMDSDQISQFINQLRSKQQSPYENGIQNSAERIKMLELFGYQGEQISQIFNGNQMNQNLDNNVQIDSQPQQIFIKSNQKNYLNLPLQQLNESTIDANPHTLNKTIDLKNIQTYDYATKQGSRMEIRQKLDSISENPRLKSKSTNVISINKIDNIINYREKNNKSQLSIQQSESKQKAIDHYQFIQQGSYCQSLDMLRNQVIPPQFISNTKDNKLIDVILNYQD